MGSNCIIASCCLLKLNTDVNPVKLVRSYHQWIHTGRIQSFCTHYLYFLSPTANGSTQGDLNVAAAVNASDSRSKCWQEDSSSRWKYLGLTRYHSAAEQQGQPRVLLDHSQCVLRQLSLVHGQGSQHSPTLHHTCHKAGLCTQITTAV